jgi:uncharacterized repeat protein (TIGR01451 family)
MKSQTLRLYVIFSWSLLLLGGLLGWGLMEPDPVSADPPISWQVNEIFVCGDGSAQFIELHNPTANALENEFGEEEIVVTNLGGTQSRTFIIPDGPDLVGSTANKSLLVATAGFGSKPGGVTPNFILPANFLFPEGGTVRFGVAPVNDSINYGALPTDGLNSLHRQGATMVPGANSPTNYAGQTGSVSCPPPPPNLLLSKSADAAGIVEAGVVLSYTITVNNSGGLAATNATIRDTLPVSTTYVPNSASNGGIFSSGIISWTNLTINPAATLTRTFRVTVSTTVVAGNKITNTAFITSAQGVSATGLNIVTVGEVAVRKSFLPIIRKN